MIKKNIRKAAYLFYKENIEGEPLYQDTPIKCFEAGANFMINAQKKRNGCNIIEKIMYNDGDKNNKNNENMNKDMKIVENIMKIIKISGFHITTQGDLSVGINSVTWEIINDFYFDNQDQLEEFRDEIKQLFEFYCGGNIKVQTIEEYQAMLNAEDQILFNQYPVRYLIKDGNSYKRADSTASYSSNVGDAIHFKLPNWISEDGYNGHDTKIIKSTENEYWDILKEEASRLEHEIRDEEYRLEIAKRNLRIIQKELNYKK